MFLWINSIVASLDSLILGINLGLMNVKLKKINFITILISNILIYSGILFLYYFFQLNFITKNIVTIFYLILAYNAYQNKEDVNYQKLSFIKSFILGASHSIDGGLIALNFVYKYPLIYTISLFSFNSLLFLFLGYSFFKKKIKKANLISAILFILLALLNYVF